MTHRWTTPLRGKPKAWVVCCLLVLVGIGSALRFSGRNWDEGHGLHPDERFLMMVTGALRFPAQDIPLFDARRSTLNPNVNGAHLFVYGTLPVYTVGALHHVVGRRLGWDIYRTGRTVTATMDTLTLLLVALLGLYLLGPAGALFATAAYAFAVVPIQLSHFYTVDPFAAFFCLATIAASLLAAATERRRTFLASIALAGVAMGAAAASKISSLPIAFALPVALWIRDRRTHEGPGMLPEDRRGRWWRVLAPTAAAAIVALVVFRFAQPYAFLGPSVFGLRLNPKWLDNLREIRRLSVPGLGFPPNIQWWARAPWFPLEQMALWGLSPLVFLGACIGAGAVAWKNLRHDRWNALAILWIWCGLNYLLFGALAGVKYLRYQLPIYGCACLLFGYAMTRLPFASIVAPLREKLRSLWSVPALGLGYGIVAIVTAALWALAFTSIYRAPVTRIEASEWILRHWPGPVNLVLRTAKHGEITHPIAVRGTLPESLETKTRQAGEVVAVLLHRVFAPGAGPGNEREDRTDPPSNRSSNRSLASETRSEVRVPLRFELRRFQAPPPGQPLSTVFTGELVMVQGLAENVRLHPTEPFAVREGERLSIQVTAGRLPPDWQLEGTRIAHETGWDDTLPMRVSGWDPYGGIYPPGIKLELYEPQLDRIAQVLASADVISISSNRVYGTITRMSRDFPLIDRYYRGLLPCRKDWTVARCFREASPGVPASSLGFRLEKTFTRHPTFAGITIADQAAEEAFTVYDHPRVLLFRKETRLSADEIRERLSTNTR